MIYCPLKNNEWLPEKTKNAVAAEFQRRIISKFAPRW